MKHVIQFTKASGAGNDFVIVDNISGALCLDFPAAARAMCSRPFGIGADGLIVLERSSSASFAMRYFNADGSFGSMCGNGGRCAGRYAFDRGYCPEEFVFESLGHAYRAVVTPGGVSLHMKDIAELPRPVSMETVNGQQEPALFLDTGSPHVVLPVEQVQHQDVVQLGRMIRHKTLFGTGGTNVDFIEKLDANSLALRTYERGVEAETMACGTGAVAAAITGWFALDMKPPILVRTQGGEVLAVRFTPAGSGVTNVVLEGSAHMLFDGTTVFDDVTGTLQKPTAEDYRAR